MNMKETLDAIGLRDLSDPRISEKLQDKDVDLQLTMSSALFVAASIHLSQAIFNTDKEGAVAIIQAFCDNYPKGEALDLIKKTLDDTVKDLMEAIYKKQKEMFKEIDH